MIRTINRWLILTLMVILLFGMILIVYTAERADVVQREKLLTETRLIKSGILTGNLQRLNGSESDLASPDYLAVKEELIRVRQADPQIRFTYVLGQRTDKTIFFFVDSEPPVSEDYSAPGDPYPEASAMLLEAFLSGNEITEGPLTDRGVPG